MASWARQRQQITEAADGGARPRTTRAGQRYYSHLGLRPPSKDFDYNQPLIREKTQQLHPAAQRAEEARALPAEHRLTKLGKGFFRDKCYEYLVQQRAERGRGPGTGCR